MQGGFEGTGNIDADPLFADPDGPDNIAGTADDDYHLTEGSAVHRYGERQAGRRIWILKAV